MNPSYACSFCMVGIPKDSLKYLSNFTNVCLHSDVSHLQVCSVIQYSNFLPVTNQHVKERLCLNPACPFRISLSTSIRILDKTMHFDEDWKLINFFLLLIREVSRIWLFYKESFVFWYIMVISLENSEDRILRALRFFFFCFCNINVDAQIWTIFNKDRPVRDYFHFFLSRRIDAYILSLSVILCHVLSEICCFQLCGIIYELMMSSSFFQYFIWITC